MNEFDFGTFDLNLLKAFDVLEHERNVTKAARRLKIGQPAMSHALARLRQIVDDPLFVRNATGMAPTPRALELIGPVRSALAQIEAALQGSDGANAVTAIGRFRIGMTDVTAAAVVPRLSKILRDRAPLATLAVVSADKNNGSRMLDDGDIDIAIGLFATVPSWQVKTDLYAEDFVCVFHPSQIKTRRPISVKQFARHPHVLVTLANDARGFVDTALEKANLQRHVAVTTPFFLLAGYLLHRMPLIATLPRHYANLCTQMSDVIVSELPFPSPRMHIAMVWHRRNDRNAGSMMLRQCLIEAMK